MKRIANCILSLILLLTSAGVMAQSSLSTDKNFVVTYTPKISGITNPTQLGGKSVSQVNTEVKYFDGLGRPSQMIQLYASPDKKDIIQPFAYDNAELQSKQYLPYSDNSTSYGSYRTSAVASQASFYNSPPTAVVQIPVSGSTTPSYSEARFEASPLNRVIEQGATGADWSISAGHTVKTEYKLNSSADTVRIWTISGSTCSSAGYYSTGDLFKTIVKNENWVSGKAGTVDEYKDKQGVVVLKRQWTTNTQAVHTYYVYDDMGNLRYVIPAAVSVTSFSESTADDAFTKYVYAYHYDQRKRLTRKKVPGKGWDEIVYNQIDQPVLTQDSVQRANNKWLFTKYDVRGRVVITGIISSSGSRAYWQGQFDADPVPPLYEARDGSNSNGTGYDGAALPAHSIVEEYHAINYYDDYDYPDMEYGNGEVGLMAGLLTGTKVKLLGGSTMVTRNYFYDEYQRLVYDYTSAGSQGALNGIYYTRDFSGQVTNYTHQYDDVARGRSLYLMREYYYSFDHMGRPTQTQWYSSFEDNDNGYYDFPMQYVNQEYNKLGQLVKKKLDDDLQEVNYRYNERGWLSAINDPANITTSQLFGMNLLYNSSLNSASSQYNGNISGIKWQTAVPPGLGLVQEPMTYGFTYDALNRLSGSAYGSGTGNTQTGYFDEGQSYDPMGNINSLTRYSKVSGSRSAIDQLSYSYSGNKLNSVTDISGSAVGQSAGTSSYTYDGNGNLNSDSGKGITNISYNHANLPLVVTRSAGNVTYSYDGTGQKTGKTEGGLSYQYENGIEFTDDEITQFTIPEGRITNNNGVFRTEYFLKDHLGNTRATIFRNGSDVAEVAQVDHYYPFGMSYESSGYNFVPSTPNDYLYNGKELQRSLKLYDYGARLYDPVIGRWNAVDPMAEKFSSLSAYNYGLNNPMVMIDPDGREAYSSKEDIMKLLNWAKSESADDNDDWVEYEHEGKSYAKWDDKVIDQKSATTRYGSSALYVGKKGTAKTKSGYKINLNPDKTWSYDLPLINAGAGPTIGEAVAENMGVLNTAEAISTGTALFASGSIGFMESGSNFLINGVGRRAEFMEGLAAYVESLVPQAVEQVAPRLISSVSGHAVHQAITRGFKAADILKIVNEGNPVFAQGRFGSQWRYMLNGNTVVINAVKNRIITIFSNVKGTANGGGAGFINPFQ